MCHDGIKILLVTEPKINHLSYKAQSYIFSKLIKKISLINIKYYILFLNVILINNFIYIPIHAITFYLVYATYAVQDLLYM